MLITAEQKNTRQTARKVRLVAAEVKKMSIEDALKNLAAMDRRASLVLIKVLRQALANAWHNHNLNLVDLSLKDIIVSEGPTYKRFRAVSRGRAHNIFKRTCHVKVVLESKVAKKAAPKKPAQKAAAKLDKKVAKSQDKAAVSKVNVIPKKEIAHVAKQAKDKSVNRITQGK